jgi:hypothetical protein
MYVYKCILVIWGATSVSLRNPEIDKIGVTCEALYDKLKLHTCVHEDNSK